MAFFRGQKVVCIKDDGWSSGWRHRGEVMPVRGCVYTIRDFGGISVPGESRIRLVEIVNQCLLYDEGFGECGFKPSRFRPATSIDDLREIVAEQLKGKPRKITDSNPLDRRKVEA